MPARTLPAEQVAEARGFADRLRAAAAASRQRAARRAARRPRRSRARCSTRSRGRGSRRWARAAMRGSRANLATALDDAAARRSDHPRAQPRRGAAVDRARPDGARAADRARAARRSPRRAWRWCATGSRRRPAAISTRWRWRSTISAPSPVLSTRLLEDLELIEGEMLPDESRRGRRRGRGHRRAGAGRGRGRRDEPASRARARSRRAASSEQRRSEEGEGERARARTMSTTPTANPATRARRACCRSAPTGRSPIWRRSSTTRPGRPVRRGGRRDRAVRRRRAGAAARLSRPAARPSAGRGHQARQPAAAPADGAAEPQLGFRSGGRAARCRAAGARGRQPDPVAQLQDRARHRFPRHRRHAADRQFGLDARPADLDRRDQRRHPRAHAGALRGQDRDPRLHHPRLEGRAEPRDMARRRPPAAAGPAQRPAPHRLQEGRRAVAPRARPRSG